MVENKRKELTPALCLIKGSALATYNPIRSAAANIRARQKKAA
jgi:hypothetical protein